MLKLGIALANCGNDVDPADLVRLAVEAERIGLDSVWVADRWLRPHERVSVPGVPVPIEMPESYRTAFDPIETLAFIAARTERIQLGTSAINALYHPPVLLARRLATLDQLSGGRLIAGVTQGWMSAEFAVAGVPDRETGERFDDHLSAMRAVWAPDPVRYRGTYYEIPPSDIGPKPVGRNGIPLVVGYATSAGIRRAARVGDGLHPYCNSLSELNADLQFWRECVVETGRDPSRMPIVLRASAKLDGAAGSDGIERALFNGDAHQFAEDLAGVAALGVDHVFLQFSSSVSTDTALARMERLVDLLRVS